MRPSPLGPLHGITTGRGMIGMPLPAPSLPATSSSVVPKPQAGTTASSKKCLISSPRGFPIAEVAADGSSVITKHAGTGGLVSAGTVTAQLLYEVGGSRYLNPDVIARLDTVGLTDLEGHRVRIYGVRGESPPETTKVSATLLSGYRNSVTFVLPGLDIEAKAAIAEEALWRRVGGKEQYGAVDVQLLRTEHDNPPSLEASFAYLKVTVMDLDPEKVGRAFSNGAIQLASRATRGFSSSPPTAESPLVVYWPSTITHPDTIVDVGRERVVVAPTVGSSAPTGVPPPALLGGVPLFDVDDATVAIPLGRLIGARSGDKGGDANSAFGPH